jgi:hypothetical protein
MPTCSGLAAAAPVDETLPAMYLIDWFDHNTKSLIVVTSRTGEALSGYYCFSDSPEQHVLPPPFLLSEYGDDMLVTMDNAEPVLRSVFASSNLEAFAEMIGIEVQEARENLQAGVGLMMPRLQLLSLAEIDHIVATAAPMPDAAAAAAAEMAAPVSELVRQMSLENDETTVFLLQARFPPLSHPFALSHTLSHPALSLPSLAIPR